MSPRVVMMRSMLLFGAERVPQGSRFGSEPTDPAWLEAHSDRPEVQILIRDAIRDGKIRVQATPDSPDFVRIVPGPLAGPPGIRV